MRDGSLRVLYLHPAAAFGGASKSLIEMFVRLRASGVQGTVLTPNGSACKAFSDAGLQVRIVRGLSQFDNTRYGYYRRLRWVILLREISLLPFSVAALWRLRHERFDLLHVNEVTLLPLGLLARYLLRVPMVVHVRSLQRTGGSKRTRWVNAWLRHYAAAVVPIDHTVAASLEADLPVSIIHNGFTIDANAERSPRCRSHDEPVRVGFLGMLIPLKGIYELVEAMRILKERKVHIECLVAGDNARALSGLKAWLLCKLGFARDVRADLEVLLQQYGLQKEVRLLGFVTDVRELYPVLDILCFPSHLNAAGRPIFEAALYSIPSVVAVASPVPDSVLHEVTGLAIPSPDPVLIADALQRLAEDAPFRRQLGRQAKAWAETTFDMGVNASLMRDLYHHVLSSNPDC